MSAQQKPVTYESILELFQKANERIEREIAERERERALDRAAAEEREKQRQKEEEEYKTSTSRRRCTMGTAKSDAR